MPDYLTADELKRLIPWGVSEDVLKRSARPVGGLVPAQREPSTKPALDKKPQESQGSAPGFRVCITLISLRHRLLDDDNLVAGCKPLRDAIARRLGIDDADPRIAFKYGQHRTEGRQGVVVVVETMIVAKKSVSDARKRVL